MMKYRHLGRSGLRVSEICLGTMSFGEAWSFGADAKSSMKTANAYAEAGGNFLDTANKYHHGQSEEIVGDIIAADRDYWVVATKYTLNTRSENPNASGNGRKNMVQAVEASLKRMKTEAIDLLWVHAWDFTTRVDEVMRGLDDLVRSGKVHYVGFSDTPAWVVSHANTLADLRGWSPLIAIQVEYSLIQREVERDLLPMSRAFDLGVLAWAPLATGILTGKYTRDGDPALAESKRKKLVEGRLDDRKVAIAKALDEVADEVGCTSAQAAVAWVLSRGKDLFPILGARTPEQIQDTLGAVDVGLEEAHLAALDSASKIKMGFPHDFIRRSGIQEAVFGANHPRLERPRPRG
jgi:aryl-alcohol dehydrogenase-like predicted oxidoreductase